MTFKKLVLASVIAAVSSGAYAVESLDDSTLSGVTGQDGIHVELDLDVTSNLIVHDTDGLTGLAAVAASATHTFDGAIVIQGFGLDTNGNPIAIDIDAGDDSVDSSGVGGPTLNVYVEIPNGTQLQTGSISVGNSNRDEAALWGYNNLNPTAVVDSATVTLGQTAVNIQLASEPQGHMIVLDTQIGGGLVITGGAVRDANSGGSIGASTVTVTDGGLAVGSESLTVDIGVDIQDDTVGTADGLLVTLNQVGDAVNGLDVRMERVYLGTTTPGYVGDIELSGLQINTGTILISGK